MPVSFASAAKLLALPLCLAALSIAANPSLRAEDPPKGGAGTDKPADGKSDATALPATDPKAQALLKDAWDRAYSLPGLTDKEKPLTRLAADAVCKAEPKGGGWGARAAAKIKMEAKTAYLKGEDFTIRVMDAKPADAGGDDGEDWAGEGIRAALSGSISKFSFALKYIIGVTPFADEFKDATFEMAEAPEKTEKCVRVWRMVLNKPFSSLYFIADKGKGAVIRAIRDNKVLTYTYETKGKKQRVTKLEFKPEPKPGEVAKKDEPKKEEPKKDDPKDAKKDAGKDDKGKDDGKGGAPGGGRWPGGGKWPGGGGKGGDGPGGKGGDSGEKAPAPGHETYTFTESKSVKGYDIFTKIETIGGYRDMAIPVTFTLSNLAVNDDATDQRIADGGCGKKGEIPGIEGYKKNDAAKKDSDKKDGDKPADAAKKDDGAKKENAAK